MEKLTVFNDFANINAAYQQQGMSPDYRDLLHYLSEGRFLVEAHAFVPIDPRSPHARDQVIEDLCGQGYLVHTKIGALAGDGYRCDFDVEITLELMRTAEIVKPDIIGRHTGLAGWTLLPGSGSQRLGRAHRPGLEMVLHLHSRRRLAAGYQLAQRRQPFHLFPSHQRGPGELIHGCRLSPLPAR